MRAWVWAQSTKKYWQCTCINQSYQSQLSTFIHKSSFYCTQEVCPNCSFKIRWWSGQYFCSSISESIWGVQRTTMLQNAKLHRQPDVRFYHSGTLKAGRTGKLHQPHCCAAVKSTRQKQSKFKEGILKDNFACCQAVSTKPIFQRSHGQWTVLYPCPCHFDGVDNVALPGTLTI